MIFSPSLSGDELYSKSAYCVVVLAWTRLAERKKIRIGALLTAEDRRGENRDFSICTSLPTPNSLPIFSVKLKQKFIYLAKINEN